MQSGSAAYFAPKYPTYNLCAGLFVFQGQRLNFTLSFNCNPFCCNSFSCLPKAIIWANYKSYLLGRSQFLRTKDTSDLILVILFAHIVVLGKDIFAHDRLDDVCYLTLCFHCIVIGAQVIALARNGREVYRQLLAFDTFAVLPNSLSNGSASLWVKFRSDN